MNIQKACRKAFLLPCNWSVSDVISINGFEEDFQILITNSEQSILASPHYHFFQGPAYLNIQGFPLERHEARSLNFTEELAYWTLPLDEVNFVCDVTVTKGAVRKAVNFCSGPQCHRYMNYPGGEEQLGC